MPGETTGIATDISLLTDKNVGQLKLLNTSIFPVNYNQKFYDDLLKIENESLTRLAFNGDVLVGAVCTRTEKKDDGTTELYIMTLGVLSAYRHYGIGSKLLKYVLDGVCKEFPEIKSIYLHVQTNNEEGLEFYKKFDFEIGEKIEDYYKRIEPPHCFVVRKNL
eukprot:TRINITY_DN9778_c0_g1_i1.p1 TRINITY_DN9778_c0_g1~~TRINITY_DN9778_c0_g1_i1.p1  ORF type:complete len:173 (-),score=37.35 TRINITY_DN9778_c0_g1_i1:55-543(-)